MISASWPQYHKTHYYLHYTVIYLPTTLTHPPFPACPQPRQGLQPVPQPDCHSLRCNSDALSTTYGTVIFQICSGIFYHTTRSRCHLQGITIWDVNFCWCLCFQTTSHNIMHVNSLFVSHVQVELFTRNVSYVGAISILLTKNWRIYRIFYNHNMRIDVSQWGKSPILKD